jgi:methylated-DNA-protein-cysteine methyltransferase-like protein
MKKKVTPLGKTFSERVIEIALSIPKGRVTTYGRIARAAGAGPMASQSITTILAKAYDEGKTSIPFHRIVYANGTIWIDKQYRAKRMKLYKQEGIEIDTKNKIKNFEEKLLEFK